MPVPLHQIVERTRRKFIGLIIGDGEEIIVQTDNINHMRRLFEKPIGSNKPVNEGR